MPQIPQSHIHARSTSSWDKQTASAGIFERHLDKGACPGAYPHLPIMHGAVKYLDCVDEHSAEPSQVILIEAGQLTMFPPEKWHNIEAMTDDIYSNIDFSVAPEVLMEGTQQRKVIRNGKQIMGKATYTVTVTSNNNSVSVDCEAETPMILLVSEVTAEVIKDLVNTVRSYPVRRKTPSFKAGV